MFSCKKFVRYDVVVRHIAAVKEQQLATYITLNFCVPRVDMTGKSLCESRNGKEQKVVANPMG